MPNIIRETTLPNGMQISYLQKNDVHFVYGEVQDYLKYGIELREGDTVFDVGANIGIFTLWIYQHCNQNVNVYIFEPIPAIFEVLQRNIQRLNSEKLKIFPFGLSQASKTVTFAYHPNAPALSSAYYPDISKENLNKYRDSILRRLEGAPPFIRRLRWIPPFLRPLVLDRVIQKAFQVEKVSCELKTVSQIVRDYNIQRIDLLKLDVEKSELDVLLGIEPQEWSKIQQVVMEVHDLDGRVEQIKGLLKEHGLSNITLEQEQWLQGSPLFNLYAVRPKFK